MLNLIANPPRLMLTACSSGSGKDVYKRQVLNRAGERSKLYDPAFTHEFREAIQ